MPKMRGIKPEFWTDDEIVELSPLARLLFIGLWNYACDNGHVQDRPKQIKMRILPGDDADADVLLDELAQAGLIGRGEGWLMVFNLGKHQKLDKRFFVTCDHPGCDSPAEAKAAREAWTTKRKERTLDPTPGNKPIRGDVPAGQQWDNGVTSSGTRRGPAGSHDEGEGEGEVDCEGEGENPFLTEGGAGETALALTRPGKAVQQAAPPTPPSTRGRRLPADWEPSEAVRAQMAQERPDVDQWREFQIFRDYWNAQTGQRAVKADWTAVYRNWIRRANPTPGRGQRQATGTSRAQETMAIVRQLEEEQR